MISPQNHEAGIGDVMKNSQENFYASIDECLLISEVHPASYEYTVGTGYSNVPPIAEGNTTSLDILAHRFHVVSIDNSYILLEQEVEVTIPKMNDSFVTHYYIGYLLSFACIGSYMIDSNTDQLLNVSHANYEAFINYISTRDEVKEKDPNFATLSKVRRMDPDVPGTYIDVSKITKETKIIVRIPLKIPLSHFLILQNMKYLPEWMGKLIIKITPTYRNIVVVPVISEEVLGCHKEIQVAIDTENNKDDGAEIVDLGYFQLNQKMRNKFTLAATIVQSALSYTCTFLPAVEFKCNFQQVTKCELYQATYQLKMDVFNRLAMQYAQIPLIFPINLINHKDFTAPINDNDVINTTLTASLMFVDSSYTVFKEDGLTSTQRFPNPGITHQHLIDGKHYPRSPQHTFEDHRSINQTYDALNVNNSRITSIGKDIKTSMQPYTPYYQYAEIVDKDTHGKATKGYRWTNGNQSTFFIGNVFSDSEVFQGGLSTNNRHVQAQLLANRIASAPAKLKKKKFSQPVIIFVSDVLLEIYSHKPSGRSQWSISVAPIEVIMNKFRQ